MTAIDAIAQRLEIQRRRNPSMGGPDSRDRRNAEDILDGLAAHGFIVVPVEPEDAAPVNDDIVQRLRVEHCDTGQCPLCRLLRAAADEVERLRAETERLMDGMELAWVIICNGRAWDPGQHDEWEAAKFRFWDDHWHPASYHNVRLDAPEQGDDRD